MICDPNGKILMSCVRTYCLSTGGSLINCHWKIEKNMFVYGILIRKPDVSKWLASFLHWQVNKSIFIDHVPTEQVNEIRLIKLASNLRFQADVWRIKRVPSAFGVKDFYLLAHLLIFSVVPREIVDNCLCKILQGKQGVLWKMRKGKPQWSKLSSSNKKSHDLHTKAKTLKEVVVVVVVVVVDLFVGPLGDISHRYRVFKTLDSKGWEISVSFCKISYLTSQILSNEYSPRTINKPGRTITYGKVQKDSIELSVDIANTSHDYCELSSLHGGFCVNCSENNDFVVCFCLHILCGALWWI